MPGHSTALATVGQRPVVLATGAGWGLLFRFFLLLYPFFPFSNAPSLRRQLEINGCLRTRPLTHWLLSVTVGGRSH